MASPHSPRLVDSFTAPKEVLREFAELAEEEDFDPFAETASKRQIASRQSDYHGRRFNRQAVESGDAFKAVEEGTEVEGGYKDAMRLQRLEKEEQRAKMDVDKTPPRAELEEAAKELAAMSGTKRKRRWDVDEPKEDKEENKENKGGMRHPQTSLPSGRPPRGRGGIRHQLPPLMSQ
ncbi:hypothetical protein A0H81_06107 [Grifola frondosa]|uniref:Uncharacterized protein n=1 Tax=Grifola frondosa TaxID=5627 RepID=A0A1C7MA69_GRIFR|nr:hypothetical protein A0H81_06107 [Grifola frondosa]